MSDLIAVEDYAIEEFVANLQVENQQLKDRIAELEREIDTLILMKQQLRKGGE